MGARPIPSATNHSQTRDEVPDGAFFLFVSKGFNDAIRLSETGRWPEIGLRTPRVSFHPPFTQIETHSKSHVFSDTCQKWIAPQLRQVRPLSKRAETPEGGVVVRGGANFRAGSAYWPEVATGGRRSFAAACDDDMRRSPKRIFEAAGRRGPAMARFIRRPEFRCRGRDALGAEEACHTRQCEVKTTSSIQRRHCDQFAAR